MKGWQRNEGIMPRMNKPMRVWWRSTVLGISEESKVFEPRQWKGFRWGLGGVCDVYGFRWEVDNG